MVLLRYFNPIGAHESGDLGENPNGIPNNLLPYVSQVAVGKLEQVQVFGDDYDTEDGTGVRDYIHVVDLAKGHVAALQKIQKGSGLNIYNLGTGKGYSVLEIIQNMEKAVGRPIPYRIVERRPGDIAACYSDPAKAKAELGWEAELDITQMCEDAWRWEVLPLFYQSVEALLPDLGAEIEYVFVDDGSSDGTLELLKAYRKQNLAVHYISFSRNFGKEAALYAGLQHATGDLVVVMDADLQDPPSMLLEMKALLDQNADLDCVGTRRTSREGEPFFRSFCADLFYRLMQKISPVALPSGVRDFRMMRRSVVDAILTLTESNRFSKGLFAWVGFKTHYLDYPNVERQAGKTSWSFRQLFFYSIEGILNFSDFPLIIAFVAGLLSCFISFMMTVFVVFRTLILGNPTSGWTSLMAVILFLGGIQLLTIGILGKYISKIYLETKKRPLYLVKEKSDLSIFEGKNKRKRL